MSSERMPNIRQLADVGHPQICNSFIRKFAIYSLFVDEMINRIDKVNSLLEHEISKIILRDFAFSPEILVTLTRVECSSNLIEAKAYISVFFTRRSSESEGGPDEKADGIIRALQKSVYDVQNKINRTLRMRPVPKIKFVKDENISKAAKIEETLIKLKKEEK